MSKLAMNRDKRQAEEKDYSAIRKEAQKAGYSFMFNVACPVCVEERDAAIQSVGYTNTDKIPQWTKKQPWAPQFRKKGEPNRIACPCGYRGVITRKQPTSSPKCKVRGCRNTLLKIDTDGLCVKCRKEIAGGGNPAIWARYCTLKPKHGCMHYIQGGNADCVRLKCDKYDLIGAAMHSKLKICNRKHCNNPVPVGRKAVCFACKPAPAKAAKPVKESASYSM